MPMRVVYTVANGEVLSENRGGVKRDYYPDPQGNTIALFDYSQNKTDTWVYFPYGEVKTRTGTNATPFGWGGTMGYYTDNSSRVYVRARVVDVAKGRWLTTDPIGFKGGWNLYGYVRQSPTTHIDPSGLQTAENIIKWGVPGLIGVPAVGEIVIAVGAAYCIYKGLEWICERVRVSPYPPSLPPKLGCTAAEKQYYDGLVHTACLKDTPGIKLGCLGNMECGPLLAQLTQMQLCLMARVHYKIACPESQDAGHNEQIGNYLNGVGNCLKIIKRKCFKQPLLGPV